MFSLPVDFFCKESIILSWTVSCHYMLVIVLSNDFPGMMFADE